MRLTVVSLFTCAAAALISLPIPAGDLDPPGAPTSTPGPEPRIPINAENTPGDSTSVFRITEPGSYYLTGNLVADTASHGIVIAASQVTLDLNGFALRTAVVNPGQEPLTGILVSPDQEAVIVRNGTISGWSHTGCDTHEASNALIEDLIVQHSGGTGIQAGFGTIVRGCVAAFNSTGITTRGSCTVLDSFVRENSDAGIRSGSGNVVSRCAAAENGGTGIVLNGGSSALDCAARRNAGVGIRAFGGCIVSRCTAHFNDGIGIEVFSGSAAVVDCNANFNLGDGICVTTDCRVENNTCSANGRGGQASVAGILATGSDNRIVGNTVTDCAVGIDVDGTGNFIAGNAVSGASSAFSIVSGNAHGPLVNVEGDGDVSGTAGANHPLANFRF